MNCTEVTADDVPVRYLAGQLSDAEREAYEGHYFECDRCFRELEILRAAGKVLAADAAAAERPRKAAVPRWLPLAAGLLAATAVALWLTGDRGAVPDEARSSPGPGLSASPSPAVDTARDAQLVRMARFEPPRYDPPRLRSATARRAAMDQAMGPYQAGDFARAVPALEDFLRRNANDTGAEFYLGASLLATGQTDAGVRRLERVRAAGDPAYDEEALYLIAKAEIGRGDLAAAAAALDGVIGLDGDRAAEARALRDEVTGLQRR